MFVLSIAKFKSCALSRDRSGDHMMPCAEVHIRAQASHGYTESHLSYPSHFKTKKVAFMRRKMLFTTFKCRFSFQRSGGAGSYL